MWSKDERDQETAAWLLQPVSIEEFSRGYYERAPLHVSRDRAGYYAKYFSLAELERVLFGTELGADEILVYKDGTPARRESYVRSVGRSTGNRPNLREIVDADRVSALFGRGCSIVFNAAGLHSASAASLVRGVEAFFRHRVNANVYLTPPSSQGFTEHYDTHDTVILQIEGTKRWRVYEASVDLPLESQPFSKREHAIGDVQFEVDLRPGDLLYLPRGVIHAARSSETLSLHVTLGVYPVLWTDVVREALFDAGASERMLRASAGAFDAMDAESVELRETLERALAPERLRAARARLERTFVTERRNELAGQLRQLHSLPALSEHSTIELRPNALFDLQEHATGARLSFSGKTIDLPKGGANIVRALAGGKATLAVLAEIDANAPDVVRRLISEGFVTASPADGVPPVDDARTAPVASHNGDARAASPPNDDARPIPVRA